MKSFFRLFLIALSLTAGGVSIYASLDLKKDDRISIVGHGIADRMQHHGWLETLIHSHLPKHQLVFRNLAVTGDEVDTWHRSDNFGSRDQWLKQTQADVIFAFYGFNESFKGAAALDQFKDKLEAFIANTKTNSFGKNGKVRLVLFAPQALEQINDPHLPDPTAANTQLQIYSEAMATLAKKHQVTFVDLFSISQKLYASRPKKAAPNTINTFHFTETADRELAHAIFQELFGHRSRNNRLEKLRAAVLDKNKEWHARYRTVDGYNVYGGRSKLEFPKASNSTNKVSNFQIMQQEMVQRDLKTANRDKRIWAIAQGSNFEVDDSNLPPVEQIESNKPDVATFLSGDEAISRMKIPENCKVNLFASEETFPELASPVQMAFDTKGRLWVAAWPSYPERTPTDSIADKLLVFEDRDRDGQADKVTTFLDGLNCPTGFQFYKDGVLVMQAPDLWFVRDTNGDGVADWKERVLMGMDSADSHHTANSLVLDPGGAIYLSDGLFHRTQVETASGPVRNVDGCIYRFEPRTFKFERYVPYNFANPHGRVFDYWGTDIITDATGNNNYFAPAFSGFLEYPERHPKMKEFWNRPSRPCPGTGILSSRHFPEEFQGNFLNLNVIGFHGIFRVKVSEEGSGLKGETIEPHLLQSDDPNFRPSAVSIAPDGSIYFADWANPLIGHMQHHIRDPNRDKRHGRIYRMTYDNRPLLKPVKIHGQSIERLLEALKTPEDDVRTRAKIELDKHDSTKVIAATQKWAATLDASDPEYQHHLMEALWVHQWHDAINEPLMKKMLRSPSAQARAAATRVLCYWRERVSDPLGMLEVQAKDENPRVRLEAIRACSFFRTARAAEIALSALEMEPDPENPDYYIKYCLDETMRALEPYWK